VAKDSKYDKDQIENANLKILKAITRRKIIKNKKPVKVVDLYQKIIASNVKLHNQALEKIKRHNRSVSTQ